jgi:hypothetical protein
MLLPERFHTTKTLSGHRVRTLRRIYGLPASERSFASPIASSVIG